MDIVSRLSDELLKQTFAEEENASVRLNECKQIALAYAKNENSIAVLSDMRANTSYIYYGKVAETLGLARQNDTETLRSIWEKGIFSRIHPDDLPEKHLQELRFIHFLKSVPEKERAHYYIVSHLRMCNQWGSYLPVVHRMFYVASHSNGHIWLALCLYNLSTGASSQNRIVNSVNGQVWDLNVQSDDTILSGREIEILRLIDKGMRSKEIASVLSISIHTVNRHRQNILEKLRVSNSVEACSIAKGLRLL